MTRRERGRDGGGTRRGRGGRWEVGDVSGEVCGDGGGVGDEEMGECEKWRGDFRLQNPGIGHLCCQR